MFTDEARRAEQGICAFVFYFCARDFWPREVSDGLGVPTHMLAFAV